jgi:DNA-binding MarR family transcriptional regulator
MTVRGKRKPRRRDEADVETDDRSGFARGASVNVAAHRDLQMLQAIAEGDRVTQRTLADKLGIALGLANIYCKRLVRKGFVKCVSIQSNRLRYLLTPKGIAEKTRLTYEFMDYSLFLYSQVRSHLRAVLEPYALRNEKRVAVFGTGEAAELAFLSIAELKLELVAIFDNAGEGYFLGQPVRHIDAHKEVAFDLLLVATLEPSEQVVERLLQLGIDGHQLATLRPTGRNGHRPTGD